MCPGVGILLFGLGGGFVIAIGMVLWPVVRSFFRRRHEWHTYKFSQEKKKRNPLLDDD